MQDLSLCLIQRDLHWEATEKNRRQFETDLEQLPASCHLLALPEMFTTGFSMNAKHIAEPMNGLSHQWLQKQTNKHQIAITTSLPISDAHSFYNRQLFVMPNERTEFSNKRHLFSISGEDTVYKPGNYRLISQWKDWRICTLICYDLRFPVWSRNQNDYDLLVYVANWPKKRSHHWRQLLIARAIENQCYVAGVNRVGRDGNNIDYSGESLVIDPFGSILLDCESHQGLFQQTLSAHSMQKYREKFPCYQDADRFELKQN
jgi:omega-amidase